MPEPSTAAQERAARIRAARDYAGISFEELGKRSLIPIDVLKRAASPTAPSVKPLPDDALERLASAADVPLWFLRDGWHGAMPLCELLEPWRLSQDLRPVVKLALEDWYRHQFGQAFDDDQRALISDVFDMFDVDDVIELAIRRSGEPVAAEIRDAVASLEIKGKTLSGDVPAKTPPT